MKKVFYIASVLSVVSVAAFAEEWTGYISDAKCGAKGQDVSHQQCAQACVKAGSAPVLVSNGKVYKIANPDKVMDHIGDKVTVKGSMKGDAVSVETIAAAE